MASAIKSVVFMLPPRHILFDTEYIRHELLFKRNAILRGQCWGVKQSKAHITHYSPQQCKEAAAHELEEGVVHLRSSGYVR